MSNESVSAVKEPLDHSGLPGYLGFAVPVTTVDGVTLVRVIGDLDCHTAPQLRSTLVALVADGVRQVTVDLSDTSFMDSTGLSVLVGALKRIREQGGDMVMTSPTSATRRLFEITGLASLFVVP